MSLPDATSYDELTFFNSFAVENQMQTSVEFYCSYFDSITDSTDSLMLYSVQLKNMYSYLNSSLKPSDIVRDLSCKQSYCNLISLYKIIIIIPCILFITNSYFSHPNHVRFNTVWRG